MDTLTFAFLSVVIGFLVSYISEFLWYGRIAWWPNHARDMAVGTFVTALIAYAVFKRFS